MTEKSVTQKPSTGNTDPNSFSKDEIDQLSDLITDDVAKSYNGEDTGSFHSSKEDDTGEFEPIKDTD